MSKATRKQTIEWILAVMAKQAATMSADEAMAQAKLSAPAFAAKYPAEVLCASSMDAVAAEVRRWNEALVMTTLDAWRKANQAPESTLCAEAEAAPFDVAGKIFIDRFIRAADDTAAHRTLATMFRFHEGAYHYLLRTDHRASSIAVYERMDTQTPADRKAEWDDPDRIWQAFEKVRALHRQSRTPFGALTFGVVYQALIAAVNVNAPQHRHLVDPRNLIEYAESAPMPVAVAPPDPIEITDGMFL